MTTLTPTHAQIQAAVQAGREALNNYSEFDSSMVPDDALKTFCVAVVTAAINVPSPSPIGDTPHA
jgi:hypothetical protein